MSAKYSILYGNPEKDQVCITHYRGVSGSLGIDLMRENTLHIIFNISGNLLIFDDNVRLNIIPGTLAIWHRGINTHPHINQLAKESTEENNEQETVVISTPLNWLETTFGKKKEALHPALQIILNQSSSSLELGKIRSMLVNEINLARDLISPPVFATAMPYWYAAKVMEVITLHLFTNIDTHDNSLFKNQIKSTNQRLITLAIDWLNQNLDEPLNLKALARHLGCSSQYISRIFSEHTGKTLTLTLRTIRINRAAELLTSRDYNVTEAAMEVGYSSLSHFTKVFISEKGVKPSQFV